MNNFFSVAILFLLLSSNIFAQELKPGFEATEYRELMLVSVRTTKVPEYISQFPEPNSFKMVYQSESIGFDNSWDLWTSRKNQAVISLRGTTGKPESWLANIYAAMVPAKGYIQLSTTDTFFYKLAESPDAAVHVGWLMSTGFLMKEIQPKIDSCYKAGIKSYFIVGHSQGGAIAYLVTAYLHYLQKDGKLPADVQFKTYCSAGPKPGNLFFAYDYESYTQMGWAYNVINAADWVPEVPFSIQTADDFSTTNPFKNAKKMIKKQKFPLDLVLGSIYNKMDKSPKNARKTFIKYLGTLLGKVIKKNKKDFVVPTFYNSNHYVRTGNIIVLMPTEEYKDIYKDSDTNLFVHHVHTPYLYLLDKMMEKK